MKDNKKIEAAKKLIELMQAYVNGKDIEKLVKDKYITITESDSIEFICIYNISNYRIKSNFRPCKDKDEFINLFTRDMENLALVEKSTGIICVVYKIYNDFIKVVRKGYYIDLPYSTLFEDYVFYNRERPIIGIKINDEEE